MNPIPIPTPVCLHPHVLSLWSITHPCTIDRARPPSPPLSSPHHKLSSSSSSPTPHPRPTATHPPRPCSPTPSPPSYIVLHLGLSLLATYIPVCLPTHFYNTFATSHTSSHRAFLAPHPSLFTTRPVVVYLSVPGLFFCFFHFFPLLLFTFCCASLHPERNER